MSRRSRAPSDDELTLWQSVTDTVAPIARARKAKAAPPADAATEEPRTKKPPPTPTQPFVRPHVAVTKPPPALATMDKRSRSRLSRGVTAIDRRIDLHGLTQAAAEARLGRFLRAAQEDGARIVLVITGKGSEDGERGVLRRMAPHWLSSPAMRDVVVGFEEAARGHGGSGALYVRIRRPQ